MYLFFDTETTGFIDNKLPRNHEKQPHICQIGALLTNGAGETQAELNVLVQPSGWLIPDEVSKIHGITTTRAERYGIPIYAALSIFRRFSEGPAELLVAHNFNYDNGMLDLEATRLGENNPLLSRPFLCTMMATTPICKLPNVRGGYKWPKLQEAHKHFFGTEFDSAHDAMADVRACARVFFELKRQNFIK